MSRLKNFSLNLLLVLISSSIALLSAELIYRYVNNIAIAGNLIEEEDGSMRLSTFQRSHNETLIYEPTPNAYSRYTGVDNHVNSAGFRDKEYTLEKPENTFRIAVLGDSIIWGFGLPVEHTFVEQLEVLANQNAGKHREIEILNFGVPGYDTKQEIAYFNYKVKNYNPDLVIIGYCLNDTFTSSWEIDVFDKTYFPFYEKSYAFEALYNQIMIAWQRTVYQGANQQKLENNDDPVFVSMKNIKREIASQIPTILLVFPSIEPFETYKNHDLHQRIDAATKRYDIAKFDLYEAFSKHPYLDLRVGQYRGHDATHPGKFGNQIAAEAFLPFLLQNYL